MLCKYLDTLRWDSGFNSLFFIVCVCVCVCAGFLILCLSHSLVEILLSIFSCPKNTQQWHHFVFIGWGVYEVAVGVKGSKGRKEVGVPTVTVQTRVWWASLTAWTGTSKWPTICRQSGEPFHWDLSPMLWLLLEWHTSTPEKLLVVRASASAFFSFLSLPTVKAYLHYNQAENSSWHLYSACCDGILSPV